MTMRLKIKISLGVFVVGLVFLSLIIFGNLMPTYKDNLSSGIKTAVTEIQKIEEPTRYFNPASATNVLNSENLTKSLASKISQMIIERNPTGPAIADKERVLRVISTEGFAQNTISDALKNFDATYFQPKILEDQLKIADNDLYFEDFQKILRDNFSTATGPITLKWESADNNNLDQLIKIYDQVIERFYQLSVPERFVSVHQKEISLLTGQKRIYEGVKKYESDPLNALIALQYQEVINKEFENLKNKIQTSFFIK